MKICRSRSLPCRVDRITPLRWTGQVTEVVGLLVESRGPSVAIGDFCEVPHLRRPAAFAPR